MLTNVANETQEINSVSGMRWLLRPGDERAILAITQQLGVPDIIARILTSRNISPENAAAFLTPKLRDFLPDPFLFKDMGLAAQRIVKAILQKEKIAILGDYDVDGATSSALLVRFFRGLDIIPIVYIPDRMKEGYGPNVGAMTSLKEQGAALVITVDCGTMAFDALEKADAIGLEVIVIDHHKGDSKHPKALAIVNPNRLDENIQHTQLAACGMTFMVLVAVNKLLRDRGMPAPDLMKLLDIVALGTICDVVPLTGVNRALVSQGLKVMRSRGNAGIAAIMESAKLSDIPSTYHAGFIIGPRINAGGRVGKSDLGTRLLSTDDPLEAKAIASELEQFNAERKAIEASVQEEALADASALPEADAVLVVAREGWHAGVIGIVAGRLKEKFHKPVAVIALKEGIGKASARSVSGVDLGAAVVNAVHAGILVGGGGHMMAAGFTVTQDNIPALKQFFNDQLGKTMQSLAGQRTLYMDATVGLSGITPALAQYIEQAGPFGAGNPSVRLWLQNIKIVHSEIVGDGHVRAVLKEMGADASSVSLRAMAFRSADTPLGKALLETKGRALHVAGQIKLNQWNGRETVDFFIDDVAL